MAETLPYHILLNLQVLINKIGTVKTVRHDAAHMCRCQNDILGLLFIKIFSQPARPANPVLCENGLPDWYIPFAANYSI